MSKYSDDYSTLTKNMLHYKQLESKQNAHITMHAYDDIDMFMSYDR